MSPERIDDIFAQTLTGDYDDEFPWNAVRKLHDIGSREVFDRAAVWCSSDNPLKRARGADVLAQLGVAPDHPTHASPDESFSIVSMMAQREKEPLPLLSALHAIGHIGDPLAVPLVVEHRLHPNANVRFAVACALGDFANDPRAVDALIALMQDVDEGVRDWATFSLGVQGDIDSEEIRSALWQRMSDANPDVRDEAMVGLGKRKDRRALPALIAELNEPGFSDRMKEAADAFLGEDGRRESLSAEAYVAALKKRFSL
jgi:HEAT repeat protein